MLRLRLRLAAVLTAVLLAGCLGPRPELPTRPTQAQFEVSLNLASSSLSPGEPLHFTVAVTNTGDAGNGQVDIRIDDEDPADFVPVEKQPVIVKLVSPEYPEFAKRIGAEGVVWVKILVDKEGKAKKASIIKCPITVLRFLLP